MKTFDNPTHNGSNEPYDLLVIGGGVNGCGIARDAAGRGLSVLLCEKGDLAEATSSASTKLFHGGLRYLEYFEFRLVREALVEREVLLKAMPHISWPLRFVLPIEPGLKSAETHSALGNFLKYTMPFLGGRRPAWLIRMGLFLYDHMGGRKILPATKTLDLATHPVGKPLKPVFSKAFEYSDCWVNDSRLVVLNARDAMERGAEIRTRTRCESARRTGNLWQVELKDMVTEQSFSVTAKGIINAGGPWVEEILEDRLNLGGKDHIRLVRGSHIVVNRFFDHDQPYFLQLQDGRVVFAIPYENDYTLIGTTDHDHEGDPASAECTLEERDYLLVAANRFFDRQLRVDDIVWTYSGVRPLFNDNASDATAATRDYVLKIDDQDASAPLLSVFGGKITTYRKLAEEALKKLSPYYPHMGKAWTATAPLPGGDFPVDGVSDLQASLQETYGFLSADWAMRLVRAYGRDAFLVYGDAKVIDDLGQGFGATLYAREVDWLVTREWAHTSSDVIWRRSKLGLLLDAEEVAKLEEYLRNVVTTLNVEHRAAHG